MLGQPMQNNQTHAGEAIALLASRKAMGKVVVTVD
jgi:hypothetical protein